MNKKILVIEDETSTLRFLEYTLKQAGYEVLLAKDGLEGIKETLDSTASPRKSSSRSGWLDSSGCFGRAGDAGLYIRPTWRL